MIRSSSSCLITLGGALWKGSLNAIRGMVGSRADSPEPIYPQAYSEQWSAWLLDCVIPQAFEGLANSSA